MAANGSTTGRNVRANASLKSRPIAPMESPPSSYCCEDAMPLSLVAQARDDAVRAPECPRIQP
ncbi:hypothetical protein GCM10009771_07550 [Nesterenkonia flava]